MKIEVEIDDNIYRLMKDVFGAEVDLGSLMSAVCQEMIVMLVAQPEEFFKAYGESARAELPQPMQNAINRMVDKFIKKRADDAGSV